MYSAAQPSSRNRPPGTREAQEKLEQLQAIIACIADGVVVLDAHGNLIDANPAALARHGVESIEALGRNVDAYAGAFEIHAPDGTALPLAQWPLSRARAGESFSGAEAGVRRRSDGTSWIGAFSAAPVTDCEGGLLLGVLTIRDVTEERRREAALRQQEQLFRSTFENAAVGIAHVDSDGAWIRVNRRLCEMLGYTHEEMLGRRFQELTHPDDVRTEMTQHRRLMQGEIDGYRIEKRYLHKNGATVWVRVTRSVAQGEDGRPAYAISFVEEITRQKDAELEQEYLIEALMEERARLATAFEKSPAFVAVLGGPEHIFEVANPAFLDATGYRDVEGKPLRMALPEIDEQGYGALLDKVYRTGEPYVGKEVPLGLVRDPEVPPERRYVDLVFQPLFEGHRNVAGIFVHGIDVTEQVLARQRIEELAQVAELERRRLRAVLDVLPVGVFIADEKGTILEANGAADRIWGGTARHVAPDAYGLYRAWWAASGSRIAADEWPLARILRTGETTGGEEIEIEGFDGRRRVILCYAAPYQSADGDIAGGIVVNVDITGRKQAEIDLRESEERFRQLADAMPQLVWTARPDGTVDYYNQRWEEFQGFTVDTGTGWGWAPVLHPEDVEVTVEAWQEAVRTGTMYQVTHRVRRADGIFRWYLSRGVPVRDREGRIVRWYGTATDIHDQKLAQHALQESEERFRSIFENASVGIVVSAEDGWLLSANQMVCDLLGYERTELLHMRAPELEHPDDRPDTNVQMDRLRAGGCESVALENRYLRRDGQVLWASTTISVVRDDEGAVKYFVSIVKDISTRKIVEAERERLLEQLADERARLEVILSRMPIGVIVAEAPEGSILFGNARAHEILGSGWAAATRREAYPSRPFYHADGRPWAFDNLPIARALRGELVENIEMLSPREDGTTLYLRASATPILDVHNHVVAGVLAFDDVSGQKRMELALREHRAHLIALNATLEERVEERTAEVRALASALTLAEHEERRRIAQILHDELQQQLFGAKIKTQLLRMDAQKADASVSEKSIADLIEILNGAITTTRQLTVDLSPPVLKGEGLVEALRWVAQQMKERYGLQVSLYVHSKLPVPSEDMRVLLFRSVRELLFNVVRHAGTDRALVQLSEAQGHLVIQVIDEGRGFDLATVSPATGAATGFGLNGMQERLGLFGGRLQIDARPGAGTEVTISVPVETVRRPAPAR